MIDWDFDGNGTKDRFFLTLRWPVGAPTQRERTNPLTGEREVLMEVDGLLTRIITDARIVEIQYNAYREEIGSRAFGNLGSCHAPKQGALLEGARTVESWPRDLTQPGVDPFLPVIA